ncbi:MAG TPA: tetratricopeptide repeat protein [Verrucomicrobiae bacterium]|nr:tetratricopeptide repeat protein [Verrucomicrobiae bacterium]
MKRRSSRNRERSVARAGRAADIHSKAGLTRGRKWLFRLVAIFVVPLVVFGAAEVVLRLVGAGYDHHFFKRTKVGGRDLYVANEDFGLRFFPRSQARFPPPVVLDAVKRPGTFRVFIFGESAAMGDPRPNYGVANYFEVLLAERFPQAKFEIINTGVTAISSHAILPIARECAGHAGDLWIIYMGNNEMVGPFGAATVFGSRAPPIWMVRSQLQLQRLRFFQVATDLVGKFRSGGSDVAGWQGMEMFAKNQIAPDDQGRQRAYRNFQRNLEDILKAGKNSGARILLSTVAVNLKDCAPFGTLSSGNLPEADRKTFDELCAEGMTAEIQGRCAAGISAFQRATEMFPHSADASYHLATCQMLATNDLEARHNFLKAADNDTLPFRADSRINDVIRTAARQNEEKSVLLCDAAETLNAASPGGVSGDELFYEHVHPNPNGNYALALAWAERVESMLPPELKAGAKSSWPSQDECEQWLGLTDWNRVSILEDVLRRMGRPPFVGRFGHSNQVARLQAAIAVRRQRMTDEAAAQAREVYVDALRRSPEDFRLHANYAEFLEDRRDWKPAIAARRKVCELIPGYYFPHYVLGVDLKEAGELAEAREALLRSIALKADGCDVWLELGTVSARQGEWERARQELESARGFDPAEPRAALFLGEVLWKLERRDEAMANWREAIQLDPMNWQPHYRLARGLAQMSDFSGSAAEYRAVLGLNPANLKAKVEFAAVLLSLGHQLEALQQLDETLRLDPTNRMAQELAGKIRQR